jgi:isopenicillin N synthase-like dioxygenase
MASAAAIPLIDIGSLFGPSSLERDATDRSLISAATEIGFLTVSGFPDGVPTGPTIRHELLRVFTNHGARDWREPQQQTDARRVNLYRGWIATEEGNLTYNAGPDVAHGAEAIHPNDPLRQETPLPPEAILPGWRSAVRAYYLGMEHAGDAIVRSLARGLGLADDTLSLSFRGGISTLRLAHYHAQPTGCSLLQHKQPHIMHDGRQRAVMLGAHADFGFVTLLAQDGVGGLQTRMPNGEWVDVPPAEDTLVANFGKLLERWTGGQIRATRHRVLSPGSDRFSIPFFYEPRVDAIIGPLRLPSIESFEPFVYGEYVWAMSKRFTGQRIVDTGRPTD